MLAKILSFGLNGITGYPVQIEIDVNAGLPSYDVVGLADTAIKESKARVRAAIKNSTYSYPINKIIINLAPADTKKEGSMYDLPIALGILVAQDLFSNNLLKDIVVDLYKFLPKACNNQYFFEYVLVFEFLNYQIVK